MRPEGLPRLLILTSSFPSSQADETCGYIRDFARSLSDDFEITVLAPPARKSARGFEDAARARPFCPTDAAQIKPGLGFSDINVQRSRSVLPRSIDPFNADADLNHLARARLSTKVAAAASMFCYFVRALQLSSRADVICSHWMVPCGLMGALISRLTGKSHIVIEHSGGIHLLRRSRVGRFVARFIVAGSDRLVTVSADLRTKLLSMCPSAAGKIVVLSMGIADETLNGAATKRQVTEPTDGDYKILFIGRLTRIKGVEILLRALQGIERVTVTVAGDGELRVELEALAKKLSVKAFFVGHASSERRKELFDDCDVVVVPSLRLEDGRTEGKPVVCLEAMAAGKPVIASGVGGLAEIIEDGDNGLLFEAGDPIGLREKLMLLLADNRLRADIARSARRSVEAYAWSHIGAKFSRLFKDAVLNGSISYRQRNETRRAE